VTSCIVDSAAIYIMVVKFRNTTCPPQPQLSLHRRVALSSYSNGTRSYTAERTQSAVYIVSCLWLQSTSALDCLNWVTEHYTRTMSMPECPYLVTKQCTNNKNLPNCVTEHLNFSSGNWQCACESCHFNIYFCKIFSVGLVRPKSGQFPALHEWFQAD
jgi:hypothetical protein